MDTLGVFLYGGLVVALCLLIGIFLRLLTLPATLRALVRRERAEGQAEAMLVLQEHAAAKVGPITASLRAREEESAKLYRDELGAAEVRARMAERRMADVAPLLDAASDLVRNLRQAADDLGWVATQAAELRTGLPSPTAAVVPSERPAPNGDDRVTVELKRPASCAPTPPAAGEGDGVEDELTRVGHWADLETLPSPKAAPSRTAARTLLSMQAPPRPAGKAGAR